MAQEKRAGVWYCSWCNAPTAHDQVGDMHRCRICGGSFRHDDKELTRIEKSPRKGKRRG